MIPGKTPAANDHPPIFFPAAFSQSFIDKHRAEAASKPWPRNVLMPISADALQAARDGHEAQIAGDRAAADAALGRMWDAEGRLHAAYETITDILCSATSIGMEHRPDTIRRLLGIDKLLSRLGELESHVAVLQTRNDQLESAMREVAEVLT
jgi:hypothetical protein